MTTLTADSGQTSRAVEVSNQAELVATNGYVQYTPASLVEARAGRVVWIDWPVGATAGEAYSLAKIVVRLVGTSDGATCVITDPRDLVAADSFARTDVSDSPLLWALTNGEMYRAGNVLAGTA
jgi:hypothetical protein